MFGTEGHGGRGVESRGKGSWNVLFFSIFRPFSPPFLLLSLHFSQSKRRVNMLDIICFRGLNGVLRQPEPWQLLLELFFWCKQEFYKQLKDYIGGTEELSAKHTITRFTTVWFAALFFDFIYTINHNRQNQHLLLELIYVYSIAC